MFKVFVIISDEKLTIAKRVRIFFSIGSNGRLNTFDKNTNIISDTAKRWRFWRFTVNPSRILGFVRGEGVSTLPSHYFSRNKRAKGLKLSANTYLDKQWETSSQSSVRSVFDTLVCKLNRILIFQNVEVLFN